MLQTRASKHETHFLPSLITLMLLNTLMMSNQCFKKFFVIKFRTRTSWFFFISTSSSSSLSFVVYQQVTRLQKLYFKVESQSRRLRRKIRLFICKPREKESCVCAHQAASMASNANIRQKNGKHNISLSLFNVLREHNLYSDQPFY